jgi:exosortase/archaeosortase family protein
MSSASSVGTSGSRFQSLPPLSYTLPEWEPSADLQPRTASQVVAGIAVFAVAAWLAVADTTFRHFEALLATPLTQAVTGGSHAVTAHDIVYFALGTPRGFGLVITNECTSAVLLIPLLVMMGSFMMFSRVSLRRQLLALAVGAALMLVVNIMRVAGICWATYSYGFDPGYKYSHVFVGSAFSLIGFVGAMLLALWILVRTERMKQAVVVLKRAWWVATAPAGHRLSSGARGMRRGRPNPAHLYRARR